MLTDQLFDRSIDVLLENLLLVGGVLLGGQGVSDPGGLDHRACDDGGFLGELLDRHFSSPWREAPGAGFSAPGGSG